jgi:hypothetical protein
MNSDTLVIIVIFASLGLLVLLSVLSRIYRSLSATSNPLPPVQPLAHHRHSFYNFQSNSKSSLLDEAYVLVDPQPHFHRDVPRPRSSSSSSTPPRIPRPTSVASSSRLSPSLSSGRRGLPHSPHSQMNIVLPAPLSGSPSTSSIVATSEFGHLPTRTPRSSSRPTSRHFLDVSSASSDYDRRSMSFVDRWLPPPSTDSYSLSTNYGKSSSLPLALLLIPPIHRHTAQDTKPPHSPLPIFFIPLSGPIPETQINRNHSP